MGPEQYIELVIRLQGGEELPPGEFTLKVTELEIMESLIKAPLQRQEQEEEKEESTTINMEIVINEFQANNLGVVVH